jgi:hypothetical protein
MLIIYLIALTIYIYLYNNTKPHFLQEMWHINAPAFLKESTHSNCFIKKALFQECQLKLYISGNNILLQVRSTIVIHPHFSIITIEKK